MKCRQCGTEFEGKFCPECGARAEDAPGTPPALKLEYPAQGAPYQSGKKAKKKKPFFLRWWFILIVIAALAFAVVRGLGRDDRDDRDDRPAAQVTEETAAPAMAAPEKTAPPEPAEPAEEEPEEDGGEADGGLDPDFKAAMDSYEAFIDEYIAFMEKYAASDGSDLSLLADYAQYMSKYAEFAEDFDRWEEEEMSTAETSYYIEVQARVAQKLLEISG